MDLRNHVRTIPDFPKPGILFYDISTLLIHPGAWRETVRQMSEVVETYQPDLLAGIESRGFLVAAPLALQMGIGFLMVRKAGKLPGKVIPHHYHLEYGSDTVEIQEDAVKPGQRVVVIDDLMATGGTMRAATQLIRNAGGDVRAGACIIELTFLKGRERLGAPLNSLITYDS
ncbi:MAG: adenine phosphoribosyltransferase [Pseudomonadota bacterium]